MAPATTTRPAGRQAHAAPGQAPLRILHVVPTYYPAVRYGGPTVTVDALAAALVRRGHEVHIYTTNMDGAHDSPVPLDRPVLVNGAAVHYFPVPRLRRLCWSPALDRKLCQSIGDFDLVHLHSIFLWPTWAAARRARASGVPYLSSPHGMLSPELIRRRSRWIKTAWIRLFERSTLRHAAALHVTAQIEAEHAAATGLPLPPIHNIPHGVEWPRHFTPLAESRFAHVARPYALFLSRISWKKGLDRLLKAWKRVPQLELVVAGNDDEGYLPRLRALARAEGIAERVHFVGHAGDADKWALYANAEMFVLPSYNENFGCVVAEAMAMSCPVVVSASVGLAALVADAGAGTVVSGDPEELAAAVRRLHADPALRRQMGERGRHAVAQHLSWDAAAAATEDLYRQCLHGHPPERP
jgi:glycosyltransferase involved in cell wall biosynthesis